MSRAALVVLALAVWLPPAAAKLVEDVIRVPVRVANIYGKAVAQDIVVTIWRDDALPTPQPVAVIGHGRSGTPQGRADLGRARYPAQARWLVQLGFMVAVPTRVGYGQSGGEDVEHSGACGHRLYGPTFNAAADQLAAALAAARQRPEASRDRGIVLGQSYGGASTVALIARNPAGIQAAINFSGGGGGDPVGAPGEPCAPQRLQRTFAGYGATARVPSLWVYTENDLYFGARYPREWFAGFRAGGAPGEFVQFPPHGVDGHNLFGNAPEVWRPRVLEFLRANGFPELKEPR